MDLEKSSYKFSYFQLRYICISQYYQVVKKKLVFKQTTLFPIKIF